MHLIALTTLLLAALFTSSSTVSANSNSNSQSFPTFSYCSYIFINEERLTRPDRSTGEENGPTTPSAANEHNALPLSAPPHAHTHHNRHHSARPYPVDTHPPSLTTPSARGEAQTLHLTHSHASTQAATSSTRHSHKFRRSADQQQQDSRSTITGFRTTLSEGQATPFTESSEALHSVPPDLFKQPDQQHYFDQQHYYQTFQHQFQFSYSPPSNSHPVYIGLEIKDVDLINDAKNFFSLQLHLFELWHEPRLNTSALQMFWERTSDPIPVNEANIADCLWTPSLVFEDSSESEQLLPPTTILLAYQNRVLLRKSRHSLKVRCHMNLQIYPMDKHFCHFKLRTFTDPVHKVDLRWLNDPSSPMRDLLDAKNNKCVIYSEEFTPSLFDIKVGAAERVNLVWLNEHYSLLDQEFIFERRMIHSLLTVYIPSSLVVTLSWLQFWFDVEAVPGRMSLGIMSTLTIMTQILTNYEKAGNHVTAVDIWLFVCLIMVFLALMEYAVAYTISHFTDDEDMPGSPSPWSGNLSLRKPHQIGDLSYKQEGDPFFATVGPIRSNILRNSLRNRRNGANQTPNQQQQTAHTPVVNFESNDNLFSLRNPQHGNTNGDPETGNISNELTIKESDATTQSPSPQPNQVIEDEEKSKLLSGHHGTDEEGRSMLNRDYVIVNSGPRMDQLDLARTRLQLALEEYNALMKEDLLGDHDSERRGQTLPNSILMSSDDNSAGANSGKGAKKRKSKRQDTDPNNNSNGSGSGNGKSKMSRFSSLRRPPLRRQASSRAGGIERSPAGLSNVDYISRYIFPVAFILFGIIYWTILFYFKLS